MGVSDPNQDPTNMPCDGVWKCIAFCDNPDQSIWRCIGTTVPPPKQKPPSGGGGGGGTGGSIGGGVISPKIIQSNADFSFQLTDELSVQFTNLSSGANIYSWSFGDGTHTSSSNPQHMYPQGGTYVVTLTASNKDNSSTISKDVTVIQTIKKADFISTISGNSALFEDTSTVVEKTRVWYFGDGNTSNELNPYHLYANDGVYLVTLIIYTTFGNYTSSQYITIEPPDWDAHVHLEWQDNSDNEYGFRIEYSLNGTYWVYIGFTDENITELDVYDIDTNELNYFRVCAYNGDGDSTYSNTVFTDCDSSVSPSMSPSTSISISPSNSPSASPSPSVATWGVTLQFDTGDCGYSGDGWTDPVMDSYLVEDGGSFHVHFYAKSGWHIDNVRLDRTSLGAVSEYTLSGIHDNHTFYLCVKPD
jgi:PKD repeat protein